MTAKPPARPERVEGSKTRALERGLRVLEIVAQRPNATLVEIASACDLSSATALRILDTLRARDFVTRSEASRTYSIGVRAFEVGAGFRADTRLRETCTLILQRIAEETGQTATLAILDGASAVVIDVREGTGLLRSAPRIGARYPAHATAPGKILLAWQWDARLRDLLGNEPYSAYTPAALTTHADVVAACAAVRARGIAVDREEYDVGMAGLAAPVRDVAGDVIAALAIQGPAPHVAAHEEEWASVLTACALEASYRLGWRRAEPHGDSRAATPLID